MSNSKLMMAAAYLIDVSEGSALSKTIREECGDMSKRLSSMVGGDQPAPTVKGSETTADSNKDIEAEAFDLVKDESKPGSALIQKKLGITQKESRAIWAKIKPRVAEHKKKAKKSETKYDPAKLISVVPDSEGFHILIDPLNELIHLAPERRAPYLTGLNLSDVVDADLLAEAAESGCDKTLTDTIIELADGKSKAIPKDKLVSAKDYKKHIMKWTAGIPSGEELFNLMSSNGLSKTVLADLRTIYDAVRS